MSHKKVKDVALSWRLLWSQRFLNLVHLLGTNFENWLTRWSLRLLLLYILWDVRSRFGTSLSTEHRQLETTPPVKAN